VYILIFRRDKDVTKSLNHYTTRSSTLASTQGSSVGQSVQPKPEKKSEKEFESRNILYSKSFEKKNALIVERYDN